MTSATCGQSMAKWEREKDERDWQDLVFRVIDRMDYDYLIELIYQGKEEGYSMPFVTDPAARAIIIEITTNK